MDRDVDVGRHAVVLLAEEAGVLVRLVDDRLHAALGVDHADPVGPRVLLVLGRPEQDLVGYSVVS